MSYTINEHKHRFAAWAASTAARASSKCRFKVEEGIKIIESLKINPKKLGKHFDENHRQWCKDAISFAKKKKIKGFTIGVAAKLINVYLKSMFVCDECFNKHYAYNIHPPIDSILLKNLSKKNDKIDEESRKTFRHTKQKGKGWSSFKYYEINYVPIIDAIKKVVKEKPLWTIEEYWSGHQD